jgi:hypothetical protein
MATSSFRDLLTEISAREPRPQINVALTNGNRVSLADWCLAADCVIERWPDGSPRQLVPIAQIVVIEVAHRE